MSAMPRVASAGTTTAALREPESASCRPGARFLPAGASWTGPVIWLPVTVASVVATWVIRFGKHVWAQPLRCPGPSALPAQNLAEVGISGQTLAASCWPAPEPRGPAAPAHVQLPAQFGDAEHAPAQLPAHGPGKGTQAALETGAMHAVGYTKIIPAFRCVSPQPVLPSQSAGNPPGTATLHRQRRRRWWWWWWPGRAVSAVQTAAAAVPPAGPGWRARAGGRRA